MLNAPTVDESARLFYAHARIIYVLGIEAFDTGRVVRLKVQGGRLDEPATAVVVAPAIVAVN